MIIVIISIKSIVVVVVVFIIRKYINTQRTLELVEAAFRRVRSHTGAVVGRGGAEGDEKWTTAASSK